MSESQYMNNEKHPKIGAYRAFAKAAELSGVPRNERLEAAKKFEILLLEQSEKVKKNLTPQALESFFTQLAGMHNPDPAAMKGVGHVLYDFGYHGRKNPKQIPESNYQFIDRATRCIESAFYGGRLFHITDDEATPLAYIINSLAKIVENGFQRSKLEGFHVEKFEELIAEVERFRNNTLFPDGVVRSKSDLFNESKKEIERRDVVGHAEYIKFILPYFIKICLITESVLRQNFDAQKISVDNAQVLAFVDSAPRSAKLESKSSRQSYLTHEFKIPGHAKVWERQLHYPPEALSFALWTVLCLRSKNAERT